MANILTISIGSMSIKLCEVSYSGNSIHLQKAAVIRTPEDSVEDGFIKDELAVIDAIQQSLAVNKFEAKTSNPTSFPFSGFRKKYLSASLPHLPH